MKKKFGKYEAVERLGRGGMAEVYRAYHAMLDRYVAVKVLHTFLADAPEFRTRFEREARHIGCLNHPNVVHLYDFDFDEESGSYFMVMELVDGLSLKDLLLQRSVENDNFSLDEAIVIISQAANALSYAHNEGMIHRDVKPANLLFDQNERLVLSDFGIAKLLTGPQMTATGGMIGTPAYMSPEQGMGDLGDERSDLYSLGIIFYELLTGKLPYDAETPLALILKHVNEPVPSVLSRRKDLPRVVDRIVQRLLAKTPEQRYQNADELIADLDKLQSQLNSGFQQIALSEPAVEQQALATQTSGKLEQSFASKVAKSVEKPVARKSAVVKPRRRSRAPVWLLLAILLGVVIATGYGIGVNNGLLPAIALLATEIPTETATATPTATSTMTLTNTPTPTLTVTSSPTLTSTVTPSVTPSHTSTAVPTDTPTDTPTATATLTPSMTFTPSLTPNVTMTLALQQTATVAACMFDYAIIEQSPLDGEGGRFFTVESSYSREITLLNTGSCAWEPNTSLAFVEGESFSAGPRIFIRSRVAPAEEVTVIFDGVLPGTGSTRPIEGRWQLRTPGQVEIGEPIVISIMVFDPGD